MSPLHEQFSPFVPSKMRIFKNMTRGIFLSKSDARGRCHQKVISKSQKRENRAVLKALINGHARDPITPLLWYGVPATLKYGGHAPTKVRHDPILGTLQDPG